MLDVIRFENENVTGFQIVCVYVCVFRFVTFRLNVISLLLLMFLGFCFRCRYCEFNFMVVLVFLILISLSPHTFFFWAKDFRFAYSFDWSMCTPFVCSQRTSFSLSFFMSTNTSDCVIRLLLLSHNVFFVFFLHSFAIRPRSIYRHSYKITRATFIINKMKWLQERYIFTFERTIDPYVRLFFRCCRYRFIVIQPSRNVNQKHISNFNLIRCASVMIIISAIIHQHLFFTCCHFTIHWNSVNTIH